jgi:hypothetical protein
MKAENRAGTLPRNWERAFGYDGEARYVAFYWAPVGDEAMYDDGQVSGDGNWRLFLTLRHENPELDQRHNVWDSHAEAEYRLLLDRQTRDLLVIPKAEAQARLRRQWPSMKDLEAELTALDWDVIQEAVQQALDDVEAAMQFSCPCDTCFYSIAPGWLRADDGGFDSCPVCQGWGFLPLPEAPASAVSQDPAASCLLSL